MGLAEIYDSTARAMVAKFEAVRAGFDHSGARGSAVEEIVRDFLRQSLPSSLGVTVGQVVDSEGTFSNQSDVIIYSAAQTPMLLRTSEGGQDCVPAEGVVAVIEVKSHLQRKDIPQLLQHARKLKTLKRTCYLDQAVSQSSKLYDQSWKVIPPMYSVFAFKSDGLYAEELNDAQVDVPPYERIDNMCALDKGFVINVCLTGNVSDPDNLFSYQPTSTTHSTLAESKSDTPLLPWYLMNSTIWNQFDCPPISLIDYFQDRLSFGVESKGSNRTIYDETVRQMAEYFSIDVDLLKRLSGHSPGEATLAELIENAHIFREKGKVDLRRPHLEAVLREVAELPLEQRESVVQVRLADLSSRGIDPLEQVDDDGPAPDAPGA